MAYIMDMASGTIQTVEEPSTKRSFGMERQDAIPLEEPPQLQLARVEAATETTTQTLHPAAIEVLLKTLED